jgi:hypothetical protein
MEIKMKKSIVMLASVVIATSIMFANNVVAQVTEVTDSENVSPAKKSYLKLTFKTKDLAERYIKMRGLTDVVAVRKGQAYVLKNRKDVDAICYDPNTDNGDACDQ